MFVSTNKTNDMKTLQINSNSIKVQYEGMTFLVSKYEDSKGVYFLNENLEKQYAELESVEQSPKIEQANKKEYTFNVDAWRGDQITNYTKTVKADSFDNACKKIEKSYKRIYDYSVA